MLPNFNPMAIRQQIENLKYQFPALVEDEDSWQASLESETSLHDFLANIVCQIDDCKALVVGTKDRFEELKARKERFERRIEALRELALKTMSAAEVARVELPIATLSLRAVPPSVVIMDEAALPDDVCRFERKPDKAKIKELLSNPSCSITGAAMSNGNVTVSIRIK
jgi:hypothetical protein